MIEQATDLVGSPLGLVGVLVLISLFSTYSSNGIAFLARSAPLSSDHYNIVLQETNAFANHYKETGVFWMTSLLGSLFALTVGTTPGIWWDLMVLAIFLFPVYLHAREYYPFSLFCEYRSYDTDSGRPNVGKTTEGIATLRPDGTYSIQLNVTTGSNIESYCLNLNLPDGVETRNLEPTPGDPTLTDDDRIEGEAAPSVSKYNLGLVLKQTTGVNPRGNNVVTVQDCTTGRILETIELLPG